MKKITVILCTLVAGAFMADAQPNTKLRPDETVLLYADSFEGNVDPVYGRTIRYAGFEMAEDNKLTGAEDVPANGNIGNISKLYGKRFFWHRNSLPTVQLIV